MKRSLREISVQFKHVPHMIFTPLLEKQFSPNVLSFRIQPDEGISLSFEAKHTGPKLCLPNVNMDFSYKDAYDTEPPEAYERLLLDCMQGDQTLFVRQDMVELSWGFVTSILEKWKQMPPLRFPNYEAGSTGPKEADELIRRDGRSWRPL